MVFGFFVDRPLDSLNIYRQKIVYMGYDKTVKPIIYFNQFPCYLCVERVSFLYFDFESIVYDAFCCKIFHVLFPVFTIILLLNNTYLHV